MKRLHTLVIACLSASLISAQLPQKELQQPDAQRPTIEIASVEPGMAMAPGALRVTGRGMNFVTDVYVESEWMPILCQTISMLEFDCPHPMAPGFHTLELASPMGPTMAVVQFLPTVQWTGKNFGSVDAPGRPLSDETLFVELSERAPYNVDDDPLYVELTDRTQYEPWPMIEFQLDNGTEGIYFLWAGSSKAIPYVNPDFGYEFYLEWPFELVATGVFPGRASAKVAFEIPGDMFSGVLYFQGLCLQKQVANVFVEAPRPSTYLPGAVQNPDVFQWCFTNVGHFSIDK